MVVETAQILSTVGHTLGLQAPYRATHKAHPAVLWAGRNRNNFDWLVQHGLGLASTYTARYHREHKSAAVILACAGFGVFLPDAAREPFVQCMPDQYLDANPVQAYRQYYRGDKARFATWKAPDSKPFWF